jgi:hypothetical protein
MKDIKNIIDENNRYKNFAEEVEIIRETKAGEAYSLYSIRNKNDVVFQAVSGRPDLQGKGFLGFINGDRARPTVFGFGVATDIEKSTITLEEFLEEEFVVNFIPKAVATVSWDIDHGIENLNGSDNVVVTSSVTAKIL